MDRSMYMAKHMDIPSSLMVRDPEDIMSCTVTHHSGSVTQKPHQAPTSTVTHTPDLTVT